MLRVIVYWTFFSFCFIGQQDARAQNLVVNGDFEAYNTCPASIGAIAYSPTFTSFPSVQNWVQASNGTSDYFHTCATDATVGIPTNGFGYQQPHSGNAYAGVFGYMSGGLGTTAYREFIATRLSVPLKKDSLYCVSFFVSPTAGGAQMPGTTIAVNSVAAFMSDTLLTAVPPTVMDSSRFVMNDTNNHLSDTSKWYQITGLYLAKGTERWITIGVFPTRGALPYTLLSTGWTGQFVNYYYIDDVSVSLAVLPGQKRTVQYCGAPLKLTAAAPSGPYRWNTGDTARTTTVSAPGTYFCLTPRNCDGIRDSIVVLPVPVSDTLFQQRLDSCNPAGVSLMLTAPITGTRYTWSNGDTTSAIRVNAPGTYTCEILKSCRIYRASFDVTNDMPELPVMRDTVVCRQPGTLIIATSHSDVLWHTASGAGPFTTQPAVNTTEPGRVLLYTSRSKGACITARVPVVVTIKGGPRRHSPELIYQCSDRPNDMKIGLMTADDDTYLWSTGESGYRIALPSTDGVYTRTIMNRCGTEVDTFDVRSGTCNDCLAFPNAFTPNNDGLNDGFRGLRRCEITEYLFRVYNRWGQMVYVTSKPEEGWDGSFRGIPAELGTYMYQCTFRNIINKEVIRVQGDVLLVR